MIRKLTYFFGVLILAMACASAPVQEMSDARQAIRSAEGVGAAQHAPQPFQQAQELLERAQSKLRMGVYGEARRLALDARELAIQAREKALALSEK